MLKLRAVISQGRQPERRFPWARLGRFALACAIGALTGLAVFSITKMTGRNLFIVTGAIAGMASLVIMQLYGHAAHLSEVKVSVPQLSELTFVVNNEARQVAWRLYVETVTRISTQPLQYDEGLIREAMASLYGLFATTRDSLKTGCPSVRGPSGKTVEHLAITMLNRELRPFLSKWHPRLREFEEANPNSPESAWSKNAECRRELAEVQAHILSYALSFARLAGVVDPMAMLERVGPAEYAAGQEGIE